MYLVVKTPIHPIPNVHLLHLGFTILSKSIKSLQPFSSYASSWAAKMTVSRTVSSEKNGTSCKSTRDL